MARTSGATAATVTGRYRRGPGGWLLGAALLIPLLLALAGLYWSDPATSTSDPRSGQAAQEAPASQEPAPVGDRLTVTTSDGRRTVTGRVADGSGRSALLEGVRASSDGVRVVDDITVDENSDAPPVTGIGTILAAGRGIDDFGVAVDRGTVTLSGRAPDQQTATAAVFAAGQSYPGMRLVDRLELPGGAPAAAAAAEPLSPECEQLRSDVSAQLTAQPVTFALEGVEVDDTSRVRLTELGRIIAQCPYSAVEVAGHTDSTGPSSLNTRLSQERAESVRAVLMEAGVSGDVLTARGYGSTRPVADNDTDAGRAANRRVEINAS
ncbi:MAG: OmpA family protein [Mobilicoccus sp.]|nr:OmpA family protein [Mobilicoccus sp.]